MSAAEKYDDRWHLDKSDNVHESVIAVAKRVRDQDERAHRLESWRRLYLSGSGDEITQPLQRFHATYNVVREAVDAMHARMAKSQPRAWIVTAGGDHELQDRSKLLTTWVDGEFERLNVYDLTSKALHDACVYGTGAIKSYIGANGRPCLELVYTGDLAVDPREESLRCVRTLYQVTNIDKMALQAQFPGKKDAIEKVRDDAIDPDEDPSQGLSDLVTVVEAWRLGVGDKPGRHVIAIEGVTLVNEAWPAEEGFPFEFIRYSRDPKGFWGIGLCERLCGTQADLNHLCMQITKSYKLWVPRLFIHASSELSVEEFNNEVGTVHKFAGQVQPFVLQMSAIGRDYIEREQHLAERMLNAEGISILAARSEKPAGLNSGKALIVHQDVESERHITLSRAYEKLHTGAASQLILSAEKIVQMGKDSANGGDYKSKLRAMGGKRTLEVVDYDDARMESDQYLVRVQPASALSKSPAGKLAELREMVELGAIKDPDAIRELLDFPDLDRYNDLESSGREVANKLIEAAGRGKQVQAIEEMPLDYAIKRCRQQICLATLEEQPENRLASLRNLMGQLTNIVERQAAEAAPPPAPAGPPMGGAPPAGPVPAPPGGGLPMPALPAAM